MSENARSLVIVEDEPLISLMIEDWAAELGWHVEAMAHNEVDALNALEKCSPTLAILDINLGSQTSLHVAKVCRDRGIPIVFTTGYTAGDIPLECGDAPVLPKPFSPDELAVALQRGLESCTGTA